jgi:GTP-binding protein
VIVHDQPGTTRDSVDTLIETAGGTVRLVDTAGLRRKSRTSSDLEKYANLRSIRAVDRSDIVVLMLDAGGPITKQDLAVASYVEKAGKGMVVAWNKWDLRKASEKPGFLAEVRSRFRSAPYLPVAFISSLSGAGLNGLVETCLRTYTDMDTRIPTGVLNREVIQASRRKPEAGKGRGFPNIYYAAQTGTRPPAFTMFVNDPSLFTPAYKRHVEKIIRSAHPFEGVPIRVRLRRSK